MADDDADQGQWDRGEDHQGQAEAFELGDDQDVDAQDGDAEGGAHVAEGDPCDLPLAVPEDRRPALVVRLAVHADVGLRDVVPVALANGLVDGHHAVDRSLIGAGEFAHDHVHVAAVAAEDVGGAGFAGGRGDFAQRDQPTAAWSLRHGHRQGGQTLAPAARRLRKAH